MNFNRSSPKFRKLVPGFIKDHPDAKEELYPGFYGSFGTVLQYSFLVDSDHAHDLATRWYLTGLGFIGSIPSMGMSKQQGSIASSTYAAKLSALRTAIEEAQILRYMICCLGCNIPSDGSCTTCIFGDNISVILDSPNPVDGLSRKDVAIYLHVLRETVAAGIIEPY